MADNLLATCTVAGGVVEFYEENMITYRSHRIKVGTSAGQFTVEMDLPLIGKPIVVQAGPASTNLGKDLLVGLPAVVKPLVHSALTERLALRPTARQSPIHPLGLGQEFVLVQTNLGGSHRRRQSPNLNPGSSQPVPPGDPPAPATPLVSVELTTGKLEHRTLYDVVLKGDNGAWTVIAPHSVYARDGWSNFGIAHITDVHVARRIDGFRSRLQQVGRASAAALLVNWNDRFRDFIKYANKLHDKGLLDVIICTGDLVDYAYEDNEIIKESSPWLTAGDGNMLFFKRLLQGLEPGPAPEAHQNEELRVPIYTTLGNHDYRAFPYELMLTLVFGPKRQAIPTHAPFNLSRDDANAMQQTGAEGFTVDLETAVHMFEVREPFAYKRLINDYSSYVVALGKHRLVMLDSGPDVGMLTSSFDAIRIWFEQNTSFDTLNEDEKAFVGNSPNSEGPSSGDVTVRVHTALNDPAAQSGLVIIGIHAPPLTPTGGQFPYYFRETQRAFHDVNVCAFLARANPGQDRHLSAIKTSHSTWFDNPNGAFKRGDTADSLDYGVSRGSVTQLLQAAAGIGTNRPANLILCGHNHRRMDARLHKTNANNLLYGLDFYTGNPSSYYNCKFVPSVPAPTSFTTQQAGGASTHVYVAAGAAADAQPQQIIGGHRINVPPMLTRFPPPPTSPRGGRSIGR
jgi:Calcineurin-like phosphoesterase